jgi:hypothetical protein
MGSGCFLGLEEGFFLHAARSVVLNLRRANSPYNLQEEERNLMRLSRFIRPTPLIAGLLAGLFAILVVPLIAQSAGESGLYYDISKEVTISGTVSAVLAKPAPGVVWGSHLILDTLSGKVDASLGRWAMVGKGALSVTPGEQVEVTGVMKTAKDKEVFVARTVKANGKVYTMRNEHGISISPQTRELAARRGETL